MPFVLEKSGADYTTPDYASTVNVSVWRELVGPYVRGCPNPSIDRAVIEACRELCRKSELWRQRLTLIDVIAVTGSDIAFVAGSPATITSTTTDFTDINGDGTNLTFVAGMSIVASNTDDNNKEFLVNTVAANTITLNQGDNVIDESAGNSVVLSGVDYEMELLEGEAIKVLSAQYEENLPMEPTSENIMDKDDPGWRSKAATYPNKYIVGQDRWVRLVYAPTDDSVTGLRLTVSLMPLRSDTTVYGFLYTDFQEEITAGALARLVKIPNEPWSDLELLREYQREFALGIRRAASLGDTGYTKAQGGFSA